jgi:hypothetical protein
MKILVSGLAASSLLLSASALAQPAQLSDGQLDRVNGGFFELDVSNTSTTAVSLWLVTSLDTPSPNTVYCSSCYLLIRGPRFSLGSAFGHVTPTPSAPE